MPAPQIPMGPPVTPPAPADGGMDWKQALALLIPMTVAGISGGKGGLGGFGEGYAHGRALYDEMDLRKRAQQTHEQALQWDQGRDLVGDQRYDEERKRREAADIMALLQESPGWAQKAIESAMGANAADPADYGRKQYEEILSALEGVMPQIGPHKGALRAAAGDFGVLASSAKVRRFGPIYDRLTKGIDQAHYEALLASDRPIVEGMTFRDLDAMMAAAGHPFVAEPQAPVNSLEALLARAVQRGDEQEAARIRREIAAGKTAGSDTGTWTDTGRVNDQGEAIYVNTKTMQTRTMPYGRKPTQTGTSGLSPSLQDDIATMKTVEDLISKTLEVGERTQWGGVGGFGQGSIAEFQSKNLGRGTPESVTLRGYIGQIKGTIAKLRGGTSFTPNEQKLLDTYTPGVNESPMSIKAKMAGLREFIQMKRKNQLDTAQSAKNPADQATRGGRQALKDRLRGPG